jgi:hypothetical protein
MASVNNPRARENKLVVQDLRGEILIYDLNINEAYCLNPTSAAIWKLCDGQNSVSEISRKLSAQFKQPVVDDLIYLALDQFKKDNLLSDKQAIEIKFNGLSRREVIRKVGFASLVALPVVASLITPTAAMAQSGGCTSPASGGNADGCPVGVTRTEGGNCASRTDTARSGDCNIFYSNLCTSGSAKYSENSCANNGIGGSSFSCVCGA